MYGSFSIFDHVGGNIHLGKRSGGWKFLWNPNVYEKRNGHLEGNHWVVDPTTAIKIYELNKKSIKAFIDRPDVEVWNEYNEKQDKKEFWDMALDWTTWQEADGTIKEAWDGRSYELYEQSLNHYNKFVGYPTEYTKFLANQGYNVEWPFTDFYSDGLRFATSTEFS